MTSNAVAIRERPQERALVKAAKDLGILAETDGALMIDLSSPQLKERFNVLAPAATMIQADPNFTPAISVVNLDQKDFYGVGKTEGEEQFALSKVQLDQIAKVAGIEDLSPQITYTGEKHQNVLVTFSARVRRPDGTWQIAHGSREWIEDDEREAVLASVPAWVTKAERDERTPRPADMTNSKFASWFPKEWARVKKFRLPMAESKARLRCYRELLTLKAKYSPAEIKKPFLVVSTSFTPDTSDLRILSMIMGQGEQATNLLFGQPANEMANQLPGTVDEGTTLSCDEDGVIIEGHATEETPTQDLQTHGEPPTDDKEIPSGPHAGKKLSEVCRDDRDYAIATFVKSKNASWGTLAEAWLAYWHGEGDDLSDITF